MNEIKKLLIMRFSAMGDVAMTVPVITLLARQYPNLRITMLTRKRFIPLFEWVPANVEMRGIELNDYKGVLGLERLYSELKKQHFDAVADLHDVLRTKYLRTRFRVGRTQVSVIDKQRKLKHAFIGHGSDAEPLSPILERYADVFCNLGFPITLDSSQPLFDLRHENYLPVYQLCGKKQPSDCWIGIAPFAAHETKIYPLEQMQQIASICARNGYKVFLFGAGSKESSILQKWQQEGIINICGRLGGLHNELLLMSKLDLMLCMDSANMHMAAMLSTPTLSIWGATHPGTGFLPWGTTREDIIENTTIACRPCSVYGNQPCKQNDFQCMKSITPETIINHINERISKKKSQRLKNR